MPKKHIAVIDNDRRNAYNECVKGYLRFLHALIFILRRKALKCLFRQARGFPYRVATVCRRLINRQGGKNPWPLK